MKPTLFALSISLVPAAFWAGHFQQPPTAGATRIAMVSGQRILAESAEARAGLAKLQARQQQRTTELRTLQQALQATQQQLARTSDAAQRAELQKKEQQQRAELEREAAAAQSDLQASQRQLQSDIRALINPVIADLVKGRDVQIVLNSDLTVVWAVPGLDITSEVVQRLNARSPAAPPKP